MDKYLAACWYVLGMSRVRPKLIGASYVCNALHGITTGFVDPEDAERLLEFAKSYGFHVTTINGKERVCVPELTVSSPASRRGA